MNNLHILKYNNYYNRIVKKEDTIEAYDDSEYLLLSLTNINFIPGNGIFAQQIVNVSNSGINDLCLPDYLVVTDIYNTEITSRWFIVETERTRLNQYILKLKRDVIVDNYNNIIQSPVFIEKATLTESDPLIYNSEQMSFNQIKKSETLLKDYTNMAWIVGYVAKNYTGTVTFNSSTYCDGEYSSLSYWPYYSYLNKTIMDDSVRIKIVLPTVPNTGSAFYYLVDTIDKKVEKINRTPPQIYNNTNFYRQYYNNGSTNMSSSIEAKVKNSNISYSDIYSFPSDAVRCSSTLFTKLINENNKIYKIGSKYYKISVNTNYVSYYLTNMYQANSTAGIYCNNIVSGIISPSTTTGPIAYGIYDQNAIYITCDEISLIDNQEYDFNLTFGNRNHCDSSAYDMFCMPYGKLSYNGILTSDKNSLSLSVGIGSVSDVVYDLQLLPYCPISDLNIVNGVIQNYLSSDDITYIKMRTDDSEVNKSFVLWAKTSNFSFNIPCVIDIDNVKIQNECDMWRLCSPNYNGIFEFNAAKNLPKGSKRAINFINVDCSYKPLTPYIHLNPDFNGLYGLDFNDARGLICGGDFGLDTITDQWLNYQVENKNYQNQFNREISSMELSHKWERAESITNAITGTFSATTMGVISANPAMAALGAVTGAGQGIANYKEQEELYKDKLSMKKDMYGFQLDNIKALPYSLSKVSALNYNNKIFPFLEYYSCTDEEKEALKSKLYYNGMTVGRIDKICNYIINEKSYIQGRLIRIEGITINDYRETQEIANELAIGLFI